MTDAYERADTLCEQLGETSESLTKTWDEYRSRFTGIDKSLGNAMRRVTDEMKEQPERLIKIVRDLDGDLAKSVTALANVLTKVEEVVEDLDRARVPA